MQPIAVKVGSNTLQKSGDGAISIKDQARNSRQKVNLNNKHDEGKDSTLQSINKSEDVYNDDIIVTKSRL